MLENSEATESIKHKPAIDEILIACSDVLDEGDIEFIKDCDLDEGLGYAAHKLVVKLDIADPEEELIRRGLLEQGWQKGN